MSRRTSGRVVLGLILVLPAALVACFPVLGAIAAPAIAAHIGRRRATRAQQVRLAAAWRERNKGAIAANLAAMERPAPSRWVAEAEARRAAR